MLIPQVETIGKFSKYSFKPTQSLLLILANYWVAVQAEPCSGGSACLLNFAWAAFCLIFHFWHIPLFKLNYFEHFLPKTQVLTHMSLHKICLFLSESSKNNRPCCKSASWLCKVGRRIRSHNWHVCCICSIFQRDLFHQTFVHFKLTENNCNISGVLSVAVLPFIKQQNTNIKHTGNYNNKKKLHN